MLDRAAAAVNERSHDEIVRSQLRNDMIPDRPPSISPERLHDRLEKLGVIHAPETWHYAGRLQPRTFMQRPPGRTVPRRTRRRRPACRRPAGIA